jgi:hypothetical protein
MGRTFWWFANRTEGMVNILIPQAAIQGVQGMMECSVATEPNQNRIGSNRLESARTELFFLLYIIESNRTQTSRLLLRIEPIPDFRIRMRSNRTDPSCSSVRFDSIRFGGFGNVTEFRRFRRAKSIKIRYISRDRT